MDSREIEVKRTEKSIHERPLEDRCGYADRSNETLRLQLERYGMYGHFEELLSTHVRDGTVVLDVACGNGRWAKNQLDCTADVDWCGVDLSSQRIREATSQIDASGAHFMIGDAEHLPFASERFDVIVSSAALHHLPNWDGLALDEFTRVLKDDGVLVFNEPLKYNPLAYTFRRVSPGPCHTPHEHPFSYRTFKNTLRRSFDDVTVRSHHVVSPVIPLMSGILGLSLPLNLVKTLYDIEQCVLKSQLKGLGMHMTGVAKSPR